MPFQNARQTVIFWEIHPSAMLLPTNWRTHAHGPQCRPGPADAQPLARP